MSFTVTVDLILPIWILTIYIAGTAALFTWKIGQRWWQDRSQNIWLIFLLFASITLAGELWSIGVQLISLFGIADATALIRWSRLIERIFTTISLLYIYRNGRKIRGGN